MLPLLFWAQVATNPLVPPEVHKPSEGNDTSCASCLNSGAIVGGIAGGLIAPLVSILLIRTGQEASGCQAEECEAFGLAYFSVPLLAVPVGAAGGALIGSGIGYAIRPSSK